MGATSDHPNRKKHTQLDAIFTHTAAMLLVSVVKSAPDGLKIYDKKLIWSDFSLFSAVRPEKCCKWNVVVIRELTYTSWSTSSWCKVKPKQIWDERRNNCMQLLLSHCPKYELKVIVLKSLFNFNNKVAGFQPTTSHSANIVANSIRYIVEYIP